MPDSIEQLRDEFDGVEESAGALRDAAREAALDLAGRQSRRAVDEE